MKPSSVVKQRVNEDKLLEAAKFNNLGLVRILLSSKTNPNSHDEVILTFILGVGWAVIWGVFGHQVVS